MVKILGFISYYGNNLTYEMNWENLIFELYDLLNSDINSIRQDTIWTINNLLLTDEKYLNFFITQKFLEKILYIIEEDCSSEVAKKGIIFFNSVFI